MTYDQIYSLLKSIAPKAKVDLKEIAETLSLDANIYGIVDKAIPAFVSQAAHETDGFRTLKEYASGAAYENRADLGNLQPGDGVKFKGRGIFQITGRANYSDVSNHLFQNRNTLLNDPAILEQPKYATLSAMYFWKSRNLTPLAVTGSEEDFKKITKKINGGLNGWADRLNYFEKAKIFFQNSPLNKIDYIIIAALGAVAIYLSIKYNVWQKMEIPQ